MKRILCYLHGTPDYGLLLRCSSSSNHVVYADADCAGCPDTRCSTSGYAVFLGDNMVSWLAKRQIVVSCSSVEVEYHAVANGVTEATWLRQLLHELQTRRLGAHLSTTIISVPCTSPPTPFSINTPNM
jgi:hypothetical protein